jgi:hypothetical protein
MGCTPWELQKQWGRWKYEINLTRATLEEAEEKAKAAHQRGQQGIEQLQQMMGQG